MVEPTARIRLYEPRDDKLVRFAIGKANLSCLAVANSTGMFLVDILFYPLLKFANVAYTNPLVLSVWIGLSCIFVQFMGWWPRPEVHGLLSYLSPLPAFGSMAVPVMFMIDWCVIRLFSVESHLLHNTGSTALTSKSSLSTLSLRKTLGISLPTTQKHPVLDSGFSNMAACLSVFSHWMPQGMHPPLRGRTKTNPKRRHPLLQPSGTSSSKNRIGQQEYRWTC